MVRSISGVVVCDVIWYCTVDRLVMKCFWFIYVEQTCPNLPPVRSNGKKRLNHINIIHTVELLKASEEFWRALGLCLERPINGIYDGRAESQSALSPTVRTLSIEL